MRVSFPNQIGITECLSQSEILDGFNGDIIENQNGTVSVFITDVRGLVPLALSKTCCEFINPNYFFDIEKQECRWSEESTCNLNDSFKIVLNPKGNDGTLFYVEPNDVCYLTIDFDYLFKIKCETLNEMFSNPTMLELASPIPRISLNPKITERLIKIEQELTELSKLETSYTNEISELNTYVNRTSYSIICNAKLTAPSTSEPIKYKTAGASAFGNIAPFAFDNSLVVGQLYCINEPSGLSQWREIIGETRYSNFIDGDQTSYTCGDVQTIFELNATIERNNIFNGSQTPTLINACDTPLNTKTNLLKKISELTKTKSEVAKLKANLLTEFESLQEVSITSSDKCEKPIDFFESFDVSMSIEIVTSANTLQTVYTAPLLSAIGNGNFYNYLLSNPNSGFYVCGDPTGIETQPNCTPLVIDLTGSTNNVFVCDAVKDSLLDSLFEEYGGTGTTAFNNSLPQNAFASQWLHYHSIITDPAILSGITNQKIKISVNINNTCGDFCVLIDEIVLDKVCTHTEENSIFLTQSPGFELEKIRDNKKSWIANTTPTNRPFVITNNKGGNSIRQTNYDVNDERLVINTKEIDLDINLAGAIETDIWCYISDNACLLTGVTTCDPCVEFIDNITTSGVSEFNYSNCCGDNTINFKELMTQPLSSITTVEDFEYFLTSELTDAKNRQTISGYPTLRALYDRYMNSGLYCGNESSKFDYMTMNQFASLVGTYWVDIVEQVIPATTIWGSTKIYSNTIFDQQKFKYKSYSSLFCGNPYSGQTILSPINGTSGMCHSVSVATTLYTKTTDNLLSKPVTSYCDSICIAQMNSGSEFIGTISIVGPNAPNCDVINENSVNENTLQASVNINYPNVSVVLVGATQPVTYLWDNGATTPTTTLQSGQHSVTVTDASCNEVTVEFTIPEQELSACWYNMQESPEFVMYSLACNSFEALSSITFNVSSFVLNNIEQISNTGYSKTITSGTTSPVNWVSSSNGIVSGCTSGGVTGLTYTNFVDLLNEMFVDLGLTSYRAQISLTERVVAGSNSKDGFYIIRPTLDTFEIKTSDTSNSYTYNLKYKNNILTDWNNNLINYYRIDCGNITLVDGEVIE